MAITLVREAHNTFAPVEDPSLSFAALPAAGNLVVVCISNFGSAVGTTTGVSDNQGNGAYTKVGEETNFNVAQLGVSMWYKENIGSPSGTFTVTVDFPGVGTGNYAVVTIMEFSGVATSSVLRDSGSGKLTVTSTDANVTTAGSAAQTGDLVVACAQAAIEGDADVAWGANATTGYTNVFQYGNYVAVGSQSVDYKVLGAGGSQSANWSHDPTSGANDGWGAVIGVFAVAGGGGGGGGPQTKRLVNSATIRSLVNAGLVN